jgi:hypothetical protein
VDGKFADLLGVAAQDPHGVRTMLWCHRPDHAIITHDFSNV